MLEAVSPVDQVLDPPEKLVIEVESSGGYFRHAWYMNDEEMYPNGDMQFREATPEKFSEFFQVFVQDPTTTSDHGVYRVELIDETTPAAIVLKTQEFTVHHQVGSLVLATIAVCIHLVSLSVEALNTTTVTNSCILITYYSPSVSECGSSQYNYCHCCGGRGRQHLLHSQS